tara:strand:- start:1207 stop:1662 length:456 start_codon:yes stop_codon:yes gene_type:complete
MSEFDKCLASAQRSLAMREHSTLQIKNKLTNKGFDSKTIENVVSEIQETGFQSDKRYTEEYIRYRQNSGYSSKKIVYELKSNGISTELINNYMENFEDDYDILFEFAQSKINNVDLNDHKTFMKFINNFKSRGFDTNIISKVLKKIKNHEK